ncbi:hypothetical protein [Vibrio rumoiensis]|uniref:Type 4 fimbrial biogenesis protein PilX N-terminal domain-containing protein n=1 Tax=Vibrio rumoiensis 1S-45 TaxID=1188252 RepID=A0A1E5E5A0_9VIBR|nr:hypothetical protein [Vibrio rumoiensis]OEF28578.1 hypothetical protein A1QC_04730 [Vibrio rumoiensis 1S-45]
MNINQKGASSLLFTGLLLIAALTLSLASYKATFFQAKRIQNEIEARQNTWLGEGAIECAFAKAQADRNLSDLMQADYLKEDCLEPLNLTSINISDLGGKKYLVSPIVQSTANQNTVHKVMNFSNNRLAGAIQSTADLFTQASTTISPPDPGVETEAGWECVAVRFKSIFSPGAGVNNQGVGATIEPPYTGFDNNGKDCLDSHKTRSASEQHQKQDLMQDPDLKPFEAMFEVSKEKWQQVRDNPKYNFVIVYGNTAIDGSLAARVSECGQKVKELVQLGHTHIWIEGSCEIGGSDLSTMAQSSQRTDGVLLLVHNGVFSLIGSGNFKGVLFQFNDGFQPSSADWNGLDANHHLSSPGVTVFDHQLKKSYGTPYPAANTAAYYQSGSFNFTGGQFLDMDGQLALFHDSLNFSYNEDVIDAVFGSTPPSWLKGSWRDF